MICVIVQSAEEKNDFTTKSLYRKLLCEDADFGAVFFLSRSRAVIFIFYSWLVVVNNPIPFDHYYCHYYSVYVFLCCLSLSLNSFNISNEINLQPTGFNSRLSTVIPVDVDLHIALFRSALCDFFTSNNERRI